MKKSVIRRTAVLLCLVGGVLAGAAVWPISGLVRTEDSNHDGRTDVWLVYNEDGQIRTIARDTNFDGRSDVHEYYTHGELTRRESDTNFDDRVDLVEEFEPSTREHVETIVDVDYDGRADLLILLREGRPVYVEWAGSTQTARVSQVVQRADDDALAALADPFAGDRAIRGAHVTSEATAWVGLSSSGGLPSPGETVAGPVLVSARLHSRDARRLALDASLPRSPRGPPPSTLA